MSKEKVLAFHNDPAIKEKYISWVKAHYVQDEIIKGKYWQDGKGCAVGCTVHSSKHDSYETELGISWRWALAEDGIFEALPNDQAKEFPLQFLEAIPVGADTEIAFRKFIIWTIGDKKDGLLTVIKNTEYRNILERTLELYKQSFVREIKNSEWKKLESDAYASASAYAYAYASASAYAYASASASAYASASASASAYAYAYAYAIGGDIEKIKQERILLMRDKALEFLREAK